MKPKFSIVIPIYNAEEYLVRALDSVKIQSFSDYEVIIINNGSTDTSEDIAKSYVDFDERFHLYSQNNQGVSGARNSGLKHAAGEYLLWLDSDDNIKEDCLQSVYDYIQEYDEDMIVWDYSQVDDSYNVIDTEHYRVPVGGYTTGEYLHLFSKCPAAHYIGVLWNKVYKLDFIKEYGLNFDMDISLGEDFIFNMKYLCLIDSVRCVDDVLYHYRWQRKDSLCTAKKSIETYALEHLRMYEAFKQVFMKEKVAKKWSFWMHFYVIKAYFDELDAWEKNRKADEKQLYELLVKKSGISYLEFAFYAILKKSVKLIKHVRN